MKKRQNVIIVIVFLLVIKTINAQDTLPQPIQYSAYIETYYNYDFNKPQNRQQPAFLYSHNRQNEININLAYLKAQYNDKKISANLALASGTYMTDNYTNEKGTAKAILEANIGLKIARKWRIDAGVLPSHIGFESAIAKDCWTLTRSLLAENSPYFETGAKISYQKNAKTTFSALVLNGWQRIGRINSTPSVGTQILSNINNKWTVNWSTFYGSDRPDSLNQMRFFNNFYVIYHANSQWHFIFGNDIGIEYLNNNDNAVWYSTVFISQYKLNDKYRLAARLENYKDNSGIIIQEKFDARSVSINLDYDIHPNALFRIEGRWLDSKIPLFANQNTLIKQRFSLCSSLAISF